MLHNSRKFDQFDDSDGNHLSFTARQQLVLSILWCMISKLHINFVPLSLIALVQKHKFTRHKNLPIVRHYC